VSSPCCNKHQYRSACTFNEKAIGQINLYAQIGLLSIIDKQYYTRLLIRIGILVAINWGSLELIKIVNRKISHFA